MTSFKTDKGFGQVLLLHLTKGEDLLNGIEQGAREAGIKSGIVLSGIGSLSRLKFHYIAATSDEPHDIFETIDAPLELDSLQGVILEGEPHLHTVTTEKGGVTHGGHLEEGSLIQYRAEISIVEINDLPVGRRAGDYGVAHFEWIDGRE